jgi:hypothetical protein
MRRWSLVQPGGVGGLRIHPAAFTVNSGRAVTATSPPGTGTVDVTVINANSASATNWVDLFTYNPSSAT